MFKNRNFIAGAVAGLAIAGVAAAGVGVSFPGASAQTAAQPQVVRASTASFAPPPGAPMSFADIIEQVSPAVVSIDVRTKPQVGQLRGIPGLENFPFDIVPRQPQQPDESEEPQNEAEQPELPDQYGSGSGFFISADGYLVTNNHVVANAEEITVRLMDERELKATIVGRDEATDLAVLKVEGRNFPFVEFETQAKPRVGDWVIALGNPLQLGHTATAGIVSAYGRDIGEQYVDYIQIDAPINRGNSGGPTFDIYGRVIGVNTAIFSPTGYSVGIGFAIPAEVAQSITQQLIRNGRIERGYIGVTIASLDQDMADSLGLPSRDGAIVTDVVPGGPSDRAGLRPGDIIVRMNGEKVRNNTELTRRVGRVRAGEAINLEVLREGRTVAAQIRSGVRPSESELAARDEGRDGQGRPGPSAPEPSGVAVLGLQVAPLDANARKRFGLEDGVEGLVIAGVTPRSDGARKGLRAGDVIISANGRKVSAVPALQSIVTEARRAERPSVLLMITREGRNYPIPIELAD